MHHGAFKPPCHRETVAHAGRLDLHRTAEADPEQAVVSLTGYPEAGCTGGDGACLAQQARALAGLEPRHTAAKLGKHAGAAFAEFVPKVRQRIGRVACPYIAKQTRQAVAKEPACLGPGPADQGPATMKRNTKRQMLFRIKISGIAIGQTAGRGDTSFSCINGSQARPKIEIEIAVKAVQKHHARQSCAGRRADPGHRTRGQRFHTHGGHAVTLRDADITNQGRRHHPSGTPGPHPGKAEPHLQVHYSGTTPQGHKQ